MGFSNEPPSDWNTKMKRNGTLSVHAISKRGKDRRVRESTRCLKRSLVRVLLNTNREANYERTISKLRAEYRMKCEQEKLSSLQQRIKDYRYHLQLLRHRKMYRLSNWYHVYMVLRRPYSSFIDLQAEMSKSFMQHLRVRLGRNYQNSITYRNLQRIATLLQIFKFYQSPHFKRLLSYMWRNMLPISLTLMWVYYFVRFRYDYFIDQKNKTLYTVTHLRKIDGKIRDLAIYGLREHVFKDKEMVDSLAGLLYRLVTTNQDSKDLFTRLFIDLLRREDFTNDTRNLTKNSLHDYLASDLSTEHLSKIVVQNVLKDKDTIVPQTHKILLDYLNDDFQTVSGKLEESLINVLWMPGIKDNLITSINASA